MIRSDEREGFIDWVCDQNDEDYEYNSRRKELNNKDFRVNKVKTLDVNAEYNEFKDFEKSKSYYNTKIATDLLSSDFEINATQLTDTLKQKYGLSNNDCNAVLRNMSNHKDVDMRVGTFDKVVKLRRRS